MSLYDNLYARPSTLLRDILSYWMVGLLGAVLLIPAALYYEPFARLLLLVLDVLDAHGSWLTETALLVVAFVAIYVFGHVLQVLGLLLSRLLTRLSVRLAATGRWVPKGCLDCARAEDRLGQLLMLAAPQGAAAACLNLGERHLFMEMTVFNSTPDVHSRFIERYNTLAFMYAGLGGAFLVAAAARLYPGSPLGGAWGLSVLWVLLGGVCMREHFDARVGFADRVIAGFLLSQPAALKKFEFYFAFGSNMDTRQMRSRCPSALLLGPALLKDAVLVFPQYSANWGGGVAGFEKRRGEDLWGVLYALSRDDLDELDRIEGVPDDYERLEYTVWWKDETPLKAQVYNALPSAPTPPSRRYKDALLHGAVENGLPKAYRRRLETIETRVEAGREGAAEDPMAESGPTT